MKCIRKGDGRFDMALDEEEWQALKNVLIQYPKTPADHHSLMSKDDQDPDLRESDDWLKESGSQHQGERKQQVKAWIESIHPVEGDGKTEYKIECNPDRADWLIEILNDIRVGCWLSLDCPTPDDLADGEWKREDWPTMWAMEISGMFQSVILKCVM